MLEQLKNLYRHILLEILLPPPRGEQGEDYCLANGTGAIKNSK
jgi:hypothetical protein